MAITTTTKHEQHLHELDQAIEKVAGRIQGNAWAIRRVEEMRSYAMNQLVPMDFYLGGPGALSETFANDEFDELAADCHDLVAKLTIQGRALRERLVDLQGEKGKAIRAEAERQAEAVETSGNMAESPSEGRIYFKRERYD